MEGGTLEAWNEDNERLERLLPELGCLMNIKSITASYMPFELSDFGVPLVIQATTALESIVKGGTPDQCGNAIVLLQYIHSRFPDVAVETYVRLLVDLKTKVSMTYISLAGQTLTREERVWSNSHQAFVLHTQQQCT